MALLAICTGYFMVIIDVTIIAVALPSIGRDLHAGVAGLQWAVDAYTLIFASLLLSSGLVADRFGAKRVFQYGLLGFAATSIGCAAADSLTWLVSMRLLQGLSAALIVPASLSLLKKGFADASQRTRALGTWAAVGGVAAALGPVLGAVLVSGLGWRFVFWVNLPVGICGMLLTARFVREIVPDADGRGLDLPGQALGIVALAALAIALIEAGRVGWSDAIVVAAFGVFVAATWGFIRWEGQSASPMLPLPLFRSPEFSVAMLVGMGLNIGFFGQLFLLPFYFGHVRGYSVFQVGLAILPQPAMAAFASFASGRRIAQSGPRSPMAIGLLTGAIGFALLVVAVAMAGPYWTFVVPLLAIGFGTAFTMPAATSAVLEAVPVAQAGIASGCLNASRQVGSLIGVALVGAFVALPGGFATGMKVAAGLSAVVFSGGAFASAIFIGRTQADLLADS